MEKIRQNTWPLGQRGFSLVSVMVASVCAGILITAYSSLFRMQIKVAGDITGKASFQTLVDSLRVILSNPVYCKEAFYSGSQHRALFNPTVLPVANRTSTPAYSIGEIRLGSTSLAKPQMIAQGFKVTGLRLKEMDPRARETSGTETRYIASLEITGESFPKRSDSQILTQTLPLSISTQNAALGEIQKDEITSCGLMPETPTITTTTTTSTNFSYEGLALVPGELWSMEVIRPPSNTLALTTKTYTVPAGKILSIKSLMVSVNFCAINGVVVKSLINGSNVTTAYTPFANTQPFYFEEGKMVTVTLYPYQGVGPGPEKCSLTGLLIDAGQMPALQNWTEKQTIGVPASGNGPVFPSERTVTVPSGKRLILTHLSGLNPTYTGPVSNCGLESNGARLFIPKAGVATTGDLPQPLVFKGGTSLKLITEATAYSAKSSYTGFNECYFGGYLLPE